MDELKSWHTESRTFAVNVDELRKIFGVDADWHPTFARTVGMPGHGLIRDGIEVRFERNLSAPPIGR